MKGAERLLVHVPLTEKPVMDALCRYLAALPLLDEDFAEGALPKRLPFSTVSGLLHGKASANQPILLVTLTEPGHLLPKSVHRQFGAEFSPPPVQA